MQAKSFKPEEYFVEKEPYYEPVAEEIMSSKQLTQINYPYY